MRRVLSFRQWPILLKIMTISVVSVALMSATILFYFAPQIEHRLLEEKKERLKAVVDLAFAIVRDYDGLARTGKVTPDEARAEAAKKLRELRYGERDYFWINDLQPRVIMHPLKPELEGQDVTSEVDAAGKRHWVEFVRAVRSDAAGAGFVTYAWSNAAGSQAIVKLSYVKLYAPWGWIIGSGIHVDDVKRDMTRIRWMLLAGNVFFIVITLSLAAVVGTGIRRPLHKVIDGLKDIASGKDDIALNKRIAISSIDEIGLLSSEFNSLMESIRHLTVFKKIIEEEDSVEEVYRRLGDVFSGQIALADCRIYEIAGEPSRMLPMYPLTGAGDQRCHPDALDDANACKAKRTAHAISSLTYPSICRHFRGKTGEEHHCVPLTIGGATVAVAQFVLPARDGRRTERDDETKLYKAEQYIKEALPVIETKRLMTSLRESSLRDTLTGLHNRRYLQEFAEKIVAGAVRRQKNVALVLCDLDHFKQVNDTYGHDAGDLVLKESAGVIARAVRESDLVVRFGGEEFLVLLVDIDEGEAMRVAEKIRERVEATKVQLPQGGLRRTISLGVSEFPTDANTLWQCIKLADVALYRAKDLGRNRAVRFTPDLSKEEAA